jgi:hypothetical protein
MKPERLILAYDEDEQLIHGRVSDRENEGRIVKLTWEYARRDRANMMGAARKPPRLLLVLDIQRVAKNGFVDHQVNSFGSLSAIRRWYGV